MIHILHGENTAKSRDALHQLKESYKDCEVLLFSSPVELTTVKQALESQSLFSIKKLLILENVLGAIGRKKRDEVSDYIAQYNGDVDIILWEGKRLSPGILGKFKSAKVLVYTYDATLFALLDSIGGDKKNTIQLLHKTIQREAPELIFFMITRHIRILLGLKLHAAIPETMKMAPWMTGKYNTVLTRFSQEKLVTILTQLFTIERSWKSGSMDIPLIATLDNLILSI